MDFEVNDRKTMQAAIAALCRFLDEGGLSADRIFDSRLVASELLGNVFKHSDGIARLQGEIRDGFVEIAVWSSAAFVPPELSRCSDVYAEHGRGLYLVDRICEERTATDEGEIVVRIRI
ncbi:MAG: ATP-binding protein [Clostridia bacterium]|nr:ATP-binding protein [Clostridia bacterium]